uniref:DNA-directed RNA polymerase subunit n=1 Tax=Eutreptia sp. CCAC 1914B TaxID=2979827 RepID=A0A977K7W8_9EUGL|nr:RNA polymerase beta' subunit [Eutreptia sp. CCAC 1914B]
MLKNKLNEYIKIKMASPEKIIKNSQRTLPNGQIIGEIKKSETINYKTLRPQIGGLFCEQIFGPIKDWECQCGKYKKIQHKNSFDRTNKIIICQRCKVEIIKSRIRRYRLGFIKLQTPIVHIWYIKNIPSYISILLDEKAQNLEKILYFQAYIKLENNIKHNKTNWNYYKWYYSKSLTMNLKNKEKFKFSSGAEAIQELLIKLDIKKIADQISNEITLFDQNVKSTQKKTYLNTKKKQIRKLRLINYLIKEKNKPEWMVLNYLPVLPPDLRPMLITKGGLATSDLNDLYKKIISRNNRLLFLTKMLAPEILIRNEKRLIQESVDALINNGKKGKIILDNNRPLKSLSNNIQGKKGRFRQNLLGKRVNYSARSVIIVEPKLKLYECGLPFEIGIELFQPFIIQKLIQLQLTKNIRTAKIKIKYNKNIVKEILELLIKGHPVLLNRAPTLHRLGMQAFQPKINFGKAIQIHPLVCNAFNADFDGDQMAVHLPITLEAQTEARILMVAANNWISPATSQPVITLSQDMILGSHFLTTENLSFYHLIEKIKIFHTINDALSNYEHGQVYLHSFIWIKLEKNKKLLKKTRNFIKINKINKKLNSRKSNSTFKYIRTTSGRILFNQIIKNFI